METKYFGIIGFLLMILFFSQTALAFDTIEIMNNDVSVKKSGYFVSEQDLPSDVILNMAQQGQLLSLPSNAKSFGFDNRHYWFFFDVSRKNVQDDLYIELKNYSATSVDLFAFVDGFLTMKKHAGDIIPIEQREIHTLPIRFKLLENDHVYYVIKTKTINPNFIGFSFGSYDQVDAYWIKNYIILFVSIGVFISLIIYNFFIYIGTRDKSYFYYIVYMVSLFLFVLVSRYSYHFSNFIVENFHYFVALINFISIYGLIMFTRHFLPVEEKNIIIKLTVLLLMDLISSILFAISVISVLYLIPILLTITYITYLAVHKYLQHQKHAMYFLIATGSGLIMLYGNVLMIQGVLIPYNLFTTNLGLFAVDWDLITLSLALAYRIRLLQQENLQKEKIIMMQSRQNHIGELSGNIAHQWRQPLNEIGAIIANLEAKLKYSETMPSKSEIIKKIDQTTEILDHLSRTITTFQSFFQNRKNSELFDVNDVLCRTIDFVNDSMKNNHIVVKLLLKDYDNLFIQGDANAFSQAVLSILLNAKDVLLTRNISDPLINVFLVKQQDAVTIMISDNGGGIKIEPIMSIFDSYVTDKDHGSGIGLFITKSIIEKGFNGSVRAKNDKNGACFEIRIPCVS